MDHNKEWVSKKIGSYLKNLRVKKRWSQGDLAEAMGYSSNQFISNIERGVCVPSPQVIYHLLDSLGEYSEKTVSELLKIQKKYLKAEFQGKKVS